MRNFYLKISFIPIWVFLLFSNALISKDLRWQFANSYKPFSESQSPEFPEDSDWISIPGDEILSRSEGTIHFYIKTNLSDQNFKSPTLYFSRVSDCIKVFQERSKIFQNCSKENFQPGNFKGFISLFIELDREKIDKELIIEFYNESPFYTKLPTYGDYSDLGTDMLRESLPGLAISIISFVFGSILVYIFFIYKYDSFYLSLGIFLLNFSIWLFAINPLSQFYLPSTGLRYKLEIFALYFSPSYLLTFLYIAFRKTQKKLAILLILYYFFFGIISFLLDFMNVFPLWKTLIPFNISVAVGIFLLLYWIGREIKRKNPAAISIGIGLIFLSFVSMIDILRITVFFTGDMVAHWGMFGFLTSLLWMTLYYSKKIRLGLIAYANRLKKSNQKLNNVNLHLEEKVRHRTEELLIRLREVNELKNRQDADYYLISQLARPFQKNTNRSRTIKIDHLTRQKKKFEFNKKTYEIGGDISIFENLILSGKPYTVFLNADAMGKSLQGAGGAIVLGAVFRSILSGIRSTKEMSLKPEDLIRMAFMDLQTIFEGFDGAMLISVFLGIIEDETGLMKYVNAEHPSPILYRDGKANFLSGDSDLKKIGFFGNDYNLQIESFRFQKGDIFICASDGREDLEVEKEDRSGLTIRTIPEKIPEVVEKAEGRIYGILEEILKYGSFSDDFSILRISFQEET